MAERILGVDGNYYIFNTEKNCWNIDPSSNIIEHKKDKENKSIDPEYVKKLEKSFNALVESVNCLLTFKTKYDRFDHNDPRYTKGSELQRFFSSAFLLNFLTAEDVDVLLRRYYFTVDIMDKARAFIRKK